MVSNFIDRDQCITIMPNCNQTTESTHQTNYLASTHLCHQCQIPSTDQSNCRESRWDPEPGSQSVTSSLKSSSSSTPAQVINQLMQVISAHIKQTTICMQRVISRDASLNSNTNHKYTIKQASCVANKYDVHATTWNSLPESLRAVDCIATFKRQLKTHYFNIYLCQFFQFSLHHWCHPGITPSVLRYVENSTAHFMWHMLT